jgi:Tfp pilus assembly protein PilF
MTNLNKIFIWVSLLFVVACSNNTLSESYKNERYCIIKGMNAAQQGKYSNAIEEYLKAYKYNQNNVFTLRELGLLYGKIGNFESSEKFYKKVLMIDARDSLTIYNLSVLYYNQENYEKSLSVLSDILLENITNEVKKMKGFNFYQLQNYEESYKELSSIKNYIENDLEFSRIYSELLLNMGKLGELHPYLSDLYNRNKENPEIVLLYGKHLNYTLGKDIETEELYKNFLIDNGPNKSIIMELAQLKFNDENYEQARMYINLIPEKLKYDIDVLDLEIKIYKKLRNKIKVLELESLISKIKKE